MDLCIISIHTHVPLSHLHPSRNSHVRLHRNIKRPNTQECTDACASTHLSDDVLQLARLLVLGQVTLSFEGGGGAQEHVLKVFLADGVAPVGQPCDCVVVAHLQQQARRTPQLQHSKTCKEPCAQRLAMPVLFCFFGQVMSSHAHARAHTRAHTRTHTRTHTCVPMTWEKPRQKRAVRNCIQMWDFGSTWMCGKIDHTPYKQPGIIASRKQGGACMAQRSLCCASA